MPEGLRWSRGWDLASSEAERIQENPDYTVGTKSAFDGKILYVADVVRGQWSAPSRDKRIYDTAIADGRGCTVKVEVVAGYKDTFTRMHALLGGKAIVRPVRPQGDKVARASAFEPLFEAGMVHVLRAHWNQQWIDELTRFPRGIKDDQVDSLVVSAADVIDVRGRMGMSR